MDSRTAAHALTELADLLELRGENRFKVRAYRSAARAVLGLDTDDIGPMHRSGALAALPGVGAATIAVLADLVETGESRYLEQLRANLPEGLLDLVRVPGLGLAKVHVIHEHLGIRTLDELEAAAGDGRLAALPKFGAKTAEKVLKGIAFVREAGSRVLFHHGLAEAHRLVASVARHPDVARAEIAGSVRRRLEIVGDVDIVAGCTARPDVVAASFARAPGVKEVAGSGATLAIRFVDGTRLDLTCVPDDEFAVAWWRATGSAVHVADVTARAAGRGLRLVGSRLVDAAGARVPVPDEPALYAAAGLAWVPPELREGHGEVDAAAAGRVPVLLEVADIRGVLHCHSRYSDGTATIAEMASAAQARGWSYLGITDHSQSAFYAGGLTRDAVLRQHDEIDALNATLDDLVVLKGIESDILADGSLDYGDEVLDRFDFVVGSIHSRFAMAEAEMTARVLAALDDPRLTILAHPTGRLLLSRAPYAIDLDAVIAKAAAVGVAVELNADPNRLDLDWRYLRDARARGATIEIGPDAHSTRGLDNVEIGVGIARKGWLERADVLNARPVEGVLEFARRRRGAR